MRKTRDKMQAKLERTFKAGGLVDDHEAQEPVDLKAEILDPSDPSLPKPSGTIGREKEPSLKELDKLQLTERAGGLVDNRTIIGTSSRAQITNLKSGVPMQRTNISWAQRDMEPLKWVRQSKPWLQALLCGGAYKKVH